MSDDRSERVRTLLASKWQTFVTLAAGVLSVAAYIPKVVPASWGLAPWMKNYGPLILFVGLYFLIRFPRLANAITRILLPPLKRGFGGDDKDRIFIGPRSYTAEDRERFYGRRREADDCWREIERCSFFILEGESGCGKSSLLNAGVLPRAEERFQVVVCRIADDPFGKVRSALLRQPYRGSDTPTTEAVLDEVLAAVLRPPGGGEGAAAPIAVKPLLLCLDQFEELFVTVRDEVRREFLRFLKNSLDGGQIHLLLSLRSDFMDLLMRLCREVDPNQHALDLGSYYTLRAFRAEQAEGVLSAMLKPLEPEQKDPIHQEEQDDFRAALVQDLLRPPRDKRLSQEDEKTVLPVELQTVGMMLESLGVQDFTVERLRRLGGKAGLLQAFVEEAKTYVFRKTGVPTDQSLLILRQLISPAGTKWAQTPKAIAEARNVPVGQVEAVLKAFEDKYLINRLPREPDASDSSPFAYEFLHEHLVHILREAPDPVLQKARDAEESLRFWKQRTDPEFAPATQRRGFRARVAGFFRGPIPILETVRLWPYASDSSMKSMLRRNLAGFARRVGTVLFIAVLLTGGWVLFTSRSAYQIALMVRDAPIKSVSTGQTYMRVLAK